MSMIIDGTNGLTFNNSTVQASAGQVLQVVNASTTTAITTTSASYVTTNLAATITPKFSTSKIQIFASIPNYNTAANSGFMITVYRGGTNLGTGTYSSLYQSYTAASSIYTNAVIDVSDSPATTSSTIYTVYFASLGGQTVGVFQNGIQGTITLMEIAA
jgi:hypothetical protein